MNMAYTSHNHGKRSARPKAPVTTNIKPIMRLASHTLE